MGLGDGVKGPQNGPPTPSPGLIKTFFLPKKEPYAAPGRNNIWLVFYCKLYSDFVNIEFSLE